MPVVGPRVEEVEGDLKEEVKETSGSVRTHVVVPIPVTEEGVQ